MICLPVCGTGMVGLGGMSIFSSMSPIMYCCMIMWVLKETESFQIHLSVCVNTVQNF